MDKFLDTFETPKLNQEDINNLNRSIMCHEVLSAKRSPGLNGFTAEFYQIFTKELAPILLKLSQKIQREGRLLNSFNKGRVTLISKLGNDEANKIKDQFP
jgi:hypothetical protein